MSVHLRHGLVILIAAVGWLLPMTAGHGALAATFSDRAGDLALEATSSGSDGAASLILKEPPLPLDPKRKRSEAEQDYLKALAFFGVGRLEEHREHFAVALRSYERAFRYDPRGRPLLRDVLTLSISLGRIQEAARYALAAPRLEPGDAIMLRRLAGHMTSEGDFEIALKLYEKSMGLRKAEATLTADDVIVAFQAGKLAFVLNRSELAAEHFDTVWKALDSPGQVLGDRVRDLLISDAAKALGLLVNDEIGKGQTPEANADRLFAEVALESGKLPQAQAAFEKLWNVAPDAPGRRFDEARLLALREKNADAIETLNAYLDSADTRWGRQPYQLLAKLLDKQKNAARLIPRLEAVHEAQPENMALGYELAERYGRAAQLDKAEALLTRLMADKPTTSGFRTLVEVYRRKHDMPKLFDTLVEAHSRLHSLARLGDEGEALVGDEAAVTALIELARKRQEGSPGLDDAGLQAISTLALEARRFDAAEKFFRARMKAKPSGQLALEWALGLLVREQYESAVSVLRDAIDAGRFDDHDPIPYYHLAGALEMLDQTEAALSAAREAAGRVEARSKQLAESKQHAGSKQLADRDFRILMRVPWILYHAKRYDQATQSYRKMIDRFDTVGSSNAAREAVRDARMALSNMAAIQHDMPSAEEWLEQVLDEYPHDIGALNDLGYLWSDQGVHLQRALRMVRQAVEADPENVAYRDSLGWVLFMLGRPQEALAELEKATAVDDPDAVILEHLAEVYERLNRDDAATRTWCRALAQFEQQGDASEVERIRKKLQTADEPAPDVEKTSSGD